MLAYEDETEYFKPLPSVLMKRAINVGGGQTAANVKLVEARQQGVPNPSACIIIDYQNTQGTQINYFVEAAFRDGSMVYATAPGMMADRLGDVLWSMKERSDFTGDFRVDIFDSAGFMRYQVKNVRSLQKEELEIFVNHNMEVGKVGFCGFGAKPADITNRPADFVVTHPARDRYHIVEGSETGPAVVSEIERSGNAGFTARVAAGMDVAVCMSVAWIIDRCRCRFDLASTRWRGHAGNVFYKGKINWKKPPAVSRSLGGVAKPR